MRPLALRAENYVRFPSLDVTFTQGSCAVVGANGAGKSAVLRGLELCLFGEGSRDLAQWLGPFQERMELTLEFEHADETYRVRRGYRDGTRGQATLDVEKRWEGESEYGHGLTASTARAAGWNPITLASTKETQTELERILGLNRRTFGASSYLAQGAAGEFTEASPADRKSILSDVLDPRGYWPGVAAKATEERKVAEKALEADRVRIGEREEFLAANTGTADAEAGARLVQRTAREAFERSEEHLAGTQAALAANAAAVERAKAAEQARREADREATRCAEELTLAQEKASQLEAARVEEVELDWQAGRVTELERQVEEQRQAREYVKVATLEKASALEAVDRHKRGLAQLERDINATRSAFDSAASQLLHLEGAENGTERCDRCQQLLGAEARAAMISSVRRESVALNERILKEIASLDEEGGKLHLLERAFEEIEVPEPPALNGYDEALREARQAVEKRAALAERIRHMEGVAKGIPELEKQLEAAELILATRAAESARAAAECQDDALAAVVDATGRQRQARAALDDANAQVTRIEEQLARVTTALGELEELKAGASARTATLELLRLAERAFGRDGVPTDILISTLDQLEADANRFLRMMPTADGTILRVQLETQREQKTVEHLKETLDVVVCDTDGPRPYETYSGGERARVNITLRLALAILLADRRGAESRLLAIDEIEGLDAEGQRQLVDVIREVAPRFDIVLVASHYGGIRDAFDNVIEVEKIDGVSRIAA